MKHSTTAKMFFLYNHQIYLSPKLFRVVQSVLTVPGSSSIILLVFCGKHDPRLVIFSECDWKLRAVRRWKQTWWFTVCTEEACSDRFLFRWTESNISERWVIYQRGKSSCRFLWVSWLLYSNTPSQPVAQRDFHLLQIGLHSEKNVCV